MKSDTISVQFTSLSHLIHFILTTICLRYISSSLIIFVILAISLSLIIFVILAISVIYMKRFGQASQSSHPSQLSNYLQSCLSSSHINYIFSYVSLSLVISVNLAINHSFNCIFCYVNLAINHSFNCIFSYISLSLVISINLAINHSFNCIFSHISLSLVISLIFVILSHFYHLNHIYLAITLSISVITPISSSQLY